MEIAYIVLGSFAVGFCLCNLLRKIAEENAINKVVDWIHKQQNLGKIECGNMEEFINNLKSILMD